MVVFDEVVCVLLLVTAHLLAPYAMSDPSLKTIYPTADRGDHRQHF